MYEIASHGYFEKLDKTIQKVQERLEKYLSNPNEENIHDVRISIRRLVVAFRILPRKIRQNPRTKKFVALHKEFFKTNSEIRDFDIIASKLVLSQNKMPEISNLIKGEKKKKLKLAQKQAKLAGSLEFPKLRMIKFHTLNYKIDLEKIQ